MEEKKTYLGSMDIFKLIAAFLVIAIHTGPFLEYNEVVTFFIVRVIARLAVPYFFMCAGFFFVVQSKKHRESPSGKNDTKYLKVYSMHIVVIYITWSFIYLFDELPRLVRESGGLLYGALNYLWRFVFIGSYYHLWFLSGLLFAIIGLYIAYRKNKIGLYLAISFTLYIIGLFGDSYYGLLTNGTIFKDIVDIYLRFFETTRNGLFFGCFYVALGGYIATTRKFLTNYILYDNNDNLDEIVDGVEFKVIIIFVLSMIGLSIEALFLHFGDIGRDYNMYVMLIPATLTLFLLIKEFNIYIKKSTSVKFRNYSMGIYFIHPIWILLFTVIAKRNHLVEYNTLEFLFATVFSVISVVVYDWFNTNVMKTREN